MSKILFCVISTQNVKCIKNIMCLKMLLLSSNSDGSSKIF